MAVLSLRYAREPALEIFPRTINLACRTTAGKMRAQARHSEAKPAAGELSRQRYHLA